MDLTLRRAKGFVQNKRDWKAVLKTPQSKRYRDCQATTNLAKRLECGRFTAALGRATLSHSHFFYRQTTARLLVVSRTKTAGCRKFCPQKTTRRKIL
jgi:hypothetical protein